MACTRVRCRRGPTAAATRSCAASWPAWRGGCSPPSAGCSEQQAAGLNAHAASSAGTAVALFAGSPCASAMHSGGCAPQAARPARRPLSSAATRRSSEELLRSTVVRSRSLLHAPASCGPHRIAHMACVALHSAARAHAAGGCKPVARVAAEATSLWSANAHHCTHALDPLAVPLHCTLIDQTPRGCWAQEKAVERRAASALRDERLPSATRALKRPLPARCRTPLTVKTLLAIR